MTERVDPTKYGDVIGEMNDGGVDKLQVVVDPDEYAIHEFDAADYEDVGHFQCPLGVLAMTCEEYMRVFVRESQTLDGLLKGWDEAVSLANPDLVDLDAVEEEMDMEGKESESFIEIPLEELENNSLQQ